MCKNDILFLKSAAKVLLFAHTAKLIAQKQPLCAQIGCFVQCICCRLDNYQALDAIFFVGDGLLHIFVFLFFIPIQRVEDGLIVLGSPFVIETVIRLVGVIGLGFDALAILVEVIAPFKHLPFLCAL